MKLIKGTTGQQFQSSFYHNYQQSKQNEKNVNSSASQKEFQKLQKSNQNLQEENNLFKVKNEVLIDMIAEVYSEFKLETDKKKSRKSPR